MKGRIAAILILAMALSLSIPATLGSGNTFAVNYSFESVPMEGCGDYMVKDTLTLNIPGNPLVPYYPASILLPQDAVVKDVKVKTSAPIVQKGIELQWGQPPCTYSDEPTAVGPNEAIYGSDNDYPTTLFNVVSIESFRGFQILNVHLFPVQYKPQSGTMKFYERMTVEVQFGKGTKNKLYRGLASDKEAIEGMVDNTDTIGTYEEGASPLATEEYIIITSSTLESTFQTLADHKANFVNGASVYTVSWITANYTGVDNAEKVRNFIIDKYTNNGTLYVLMGGDVSQVPYRGFYIYSGGYVDYDMAADMYFGCLDGNWNDDGDSYWAEPGEEDWYYEVAVGRAPVDNVTEAQNFVNKVIDYELAPKPEKVQFHQARVRSNNNPDSRCAAWNCEVYVPAAWTKLYMFEEDGTNTKQMWIDAHAGHPLIFQHIGHGNTSIYEINYENGGSITWSNSDMSSLTNTFWPWHTSVACITGEFEASDCLAEEYVKADGGAIGCFFNDNYGWFSTLDACKYSGEFVEMQFRALFSDNQQKLGDILATSKAYMASSANSNATYRWCYYEINLIGDPESPCLTQRAAGDTVTITNPQDGDTVSGTVLITASGSGCIDTVEFYIDSVLKSTDAAAPFEWSWDTTQYADGGHTIEVKGYCSGVYTDNDIINVTVNNAVPPAVTITYPYDGDTLSGIVTVTTDTQGVDEVRFYVNGELTYTDYTEPFTWDWDTTQYKNRGGYRLGADGYSGGVFGDSDEIKVKISNPSIALLSFLVLFLSAGIYYKRR